MDTHRMRSDLEAFINAGLSDGWGGWPTRKNTDGKGTANDSHRPPAERYLDDKTWQRLGLCNC